jgi:hypothetical protein
MTENWTKPKRWTGRRRFYLVTSRSISSISALTLTAISVNLVDLAVPLPASYRAFAGVLDNSPWPLGLCEQ